MDSVDGLNGPTWLPAGVPQILGEYRLVRPLGRGGMGMVFEARHRLLNNSAAVKILHPQLFPERHLVTRFQREMAAVGRIPPHDNLVRAKHAGEENGLLYLVMDLIEGEDLGKLLARHQTLPVPVACEIIRQALIGLQVLYEVKLVHRDLKPGNLMLTRGGLVKLLDLGLARILETTVGQSELTPSQATMGTFDYQAPEQAYDARIADIRADIYSLGCTLYKLITGVVPFANCMVPAAKIRAHASLPFPSLRAVAPEALDAVLARMVAKESAERFQTPLEAAAALAAFTQTDTDLSSWVSTEQPAESDVWLCDPNTTPGMSEGITPHAPIVSTIPYAKPPSPRRWKRFGIPIGIALIAVFSVAVWNMSGRNSQNDESRLQPFIPSEQIDENTVGLNEILPIGSPLFQLDDEKPYVSQNLLQRPPVLALWNPAQGRASHSYDFGKQEIHLDTPTATMMHLGTTNADSFTFQVQFYQPKWTEGLGLYYGYHTDTMTGKPAFMFLDFSENMTKERTFEVGVIRGIGRTFVDERGPLMFRTGDRRHVIERPVRASLLFIEVKNGKLVHVSLDGTKHLTMTTEFPGSERLKELPPQGALGIYGVSTAGTVKEARFKRMSD